MDKQQYVSVGNIIEQERLRRQAQISKGIQSNPIDHIEKAYNEDFGGNLEKGFEDENLIRFASDISEFNKAETEFALHKIQRQMNADPESELLKSMRTIALNHINDIEKGVYADTPENRKLGRVGKQYGGKGSRGGKVHETQWEQAAKWDDAYEQHYKEKHLMIDSSGYPANNHPKVERLRVISLKGDKATPEEKKEAKEIQDEIKKQTEAFKESAKDYGLRQISKTAESFSKYGPRVGVNKMSKKMLDKVGANFGVTYSKGDYNVEAMCYKDNDGSEVWSVYEDKEGGKDKEFDNEKDAVKFFGKLIV